MTSDKARLGEHQLDPKSPNGQRRSRPNRKFHCRQWQKPTKSRNSHPAFTVKDAEPWAGKAFYIGLRYESNLQFRREPTHETRSRNIRIRPTIGRSIAHRRPGNRRIAEHGTTKLPRSWQEPMYGPLDDGNFLSELHAGRRLERMRSVQQRNVFRMRLHEPDRLRWWSLDGQHRILWRQTRPVKPFSESIQLGGKRLPLLFYFSKPIQRKHSPMTEKRKEEKKKTKLKQRKKQGQHRNNSNRGFPRKNT